jgi:rSAM/selenodomain-associated transferase 1
MSTTLVIFARLPVPGRVKTRLAAAIGAERACQLYSAFLTDLVQRLGNSCDRRLLAYTPESPAAVAFFQKLASDEFSLWSQPDGPLGERLSRCFETHLSATGRVIVIGSDAPTLPRELIAEAGAALGKSDCVLGPATDGGYYLVGLRRPCPRMFSDIAWDGPDVLEQTVVRLRSAGLSLRLLPPWYDVDVPADLQTLRGHLAAWRAAGIDPLVPRTERLLCESAVADDG